MAGDQEKMAGIETQIEAIRSANGKDVAEVEKLLISDKGGALFQEFQTARAAFWGSLDETLKASRVGTPEAKRRAAEMMNVRVQPRQDKYAEAAENLVAYNKSLADDAGKSAQASIGSARTGIVICLGTSLLLAILISLVVVRSITRPLSIAVGLVNHVTQGDLAHTAEVTSGDELGQMLEAMNGMVENLKGAAHVAERVSEGDLSVQAKALSGTDTLGQALVRMVQNLGGLVEVNKVLHQMSVNDYTTEVKGSYPGIFGEVADSTNLSQERLRHAVAVSRKMAAGDYNAELAELKKLGKRSENDTLVPAYIQVMESITPSPAMRRCWPRQRPMEIMARAPMCRGIRANTAKQLKASTARSIPSLKRFTGTSRLSTRYPRPFTCWIRT